MGEEGREIGRSRHTQRKPQRHTYRETDTEILGGGEREGGRQREGEIWRKCEAQEEREGSRP